LCPYQKVLYLPKRFVLSGHWDDVPTSIVPTVPKGHPSLWFSFPEEGRHKLLPLLLLEDPDRKILCSGKYWPIPVLLFSYTKYRWPCAGLVGWGKFPKNGEPPQVPDPICHY